jgi:hypothetical protein
MFCVLTILRRPEHACPRCPLPLTLLKGERPDAEAFVLAIQLECVCLSADSFGPLPADPLQVEQVPPKTGFPSSG